MAHKDTHSVLVTGATGFVGAALVARLALDGLAVRAVVRNKVSPTTAKIDVVRVSELSAETDWSDALANMDAVIHLAARVHVMTDTANDPLTEYRRVNVEGTLNLANQAAAAGIKRFIFMSSIKVNGEKTVLNPFLADDAPDPQDPYGISKYEAEQGLLRLAAETGMEVTIIRSPLVYGPGVKANFLSMMRWLKRGIPLPFGAIQNKRSLVALDNLIDLIAICIHHPAAANQIFLVSDDEDLSTTELLCRMGHALDRPARFIRLPAAAIKVGAALLGRHNLAQRLCGSLQVDIKKTKELLGWSPPINVEEGLRRTVAGLHSSR
jgi:nucleoside-diphosphate-sugar epimerase